jgi:hypothetical protein
MSGLTAIGLAELEEVVLFESPDLDGDAAPMQPPRCGPPSYRALGDAEPSGDVRDKKRETGACTDR